MSYQTLTTQQNVLGYLRQVFGRIVADAQAGYEAEGRGAVVLDLRHSPEVSGGYLSLSRMLVDFPDISADEASTAIQNYNPLCEVVVLVRLLPDRVLVYHFRYIVD